MATLSALGFARPFLSALILVEVTSICSYGDSLAFGRGPSVSFIDSAHQMREPRSKAFFDGLIGKTKINKCCCVGSLEPHFQKMRLVMVQDLFIRPGRIDLELKRACAGSDDGLW